MSKPLIRAWYAFAVSFVAVLAVAGASVWYSAHVQRQNDQRWCALLTQLTDAQRASPPPSPSGKAFAAELENLRREFHCH